eukprot:6093396-Prymnesium_polylepis.1
MQPCQATFWPDRNLRCIRREGGARPFGRLRVVVERGHGVDPPKASAAACLTCVEIDKRGDEAVCSREWAGARPLYRTSGVRIVVLLHGDRPIPIHRITVLLEELAALISGDLQRLELGHVHVRERGETPTQAIDLFGTYHAAR